MAVVRGDPAEHDLDELLIHYFGTSLQAKLTPEARAAGTSRLRSDFEDEQEPTRRTALWLVLRIVGEAPDVDTALHNEADRTAARTFVGILDAAGRLTPTP